jgi:hypothetical protein
MVLDILPFFFVESLDFYGDIISPKSIPDAFVSGASLKPLAVLPWA